MARKPAPPSEPQNSPEVIEALKEVTGFDAVMVQVGTREADGSPILSEGYRVLADGEHQFFNELRQSCHVPAHRVREALDAPAPAAPTAPADDAPAPAKAPRGTRPAPPAA